MYKILEVLFGFVGLYSIATRFYLVFSTEMERSNKPEFFLIVMAAVVLMYYFSALRILMGMIFHKQSKLVEFEALLFCWVVIVAVYVAENADILYRVTLDNPFFLSWLSVFVLVPLFALFEKCVFGTAK